MVAIVSMEMTTITMEYQQLQHAIHCPRILAMVVNVYLSAIRFILVDVELALRALSVKTVE
jgi:hypothetical protein